MRYPLKLSLMLILLFALVGINTVYAEGNIGFSLSRALDDQNWGVVGEYGTKAGPADIEIEGNLQSGDVYDGDIDIDLLFDVGAIAIKLSSDNTLTGYELDSLGRDNLLGASLVIPLADSTSVAVGIFGRHGNPISPHTALGTLTDAGFTGSDFDGLGLDAIELGTGIKIKDGSSLNASVETEVQFGRVEVELQGLLELLGDGDKVHQFKSNISTGGNLVGSLTWNLSADIDAQITGGEAYLSSSYLATVGYAF